MGGQSDCKVSGKDTDGDLCIYDTLRQEKGGAGTSGISDVTFVLY
jgi:hypothetical protein